MKTIIFGEVTFEYCEESILELERHDSVTPIWEKDKCVMLLIKIYKNKKAFYLNTNSEHLGIYTNVNANHLSQETTYIILNNTRLIISLNSIILWQN